MASETLIIYVNPDPNDKQNKDGGLYSLEAAVYTAPAYRMEHGTADKPLVLLAAGGVIANIIDDEDGIGGMCYLINLPELQAKTGVPRRPKMGVSQLLVAIRSMLARTKAAVAHSKDEQITNDVAALVAHVPAGNNEHLNDNLIVYVNPDPNDMGNPNGAVYSIPPAVYATTKVAAETAASAAYLLSEGVVLADMPEDAGEATGYLLNLPAMTPLPVNPADVYARAAPKMTPSQLLGAIKAMLRQTQCANSDTSDAQTELRIQELLKKFA